jgi:hypothetical protein
VGGGHAASADPMSAATTAAEEVDAIKARLAVLSVCAQKKKKPTPKGSRREQSVK